LKEAVLVALLQRERTGRGTHVSVSLLRSGLAALANQGAGWLWSGVPAAAMGSAHPSIVPYGEPLACADGGRVVLAVGTDRQFQALGRALADPGLAEKPRFARNADRVLHRRELEDRVRALVARFETEDLLARLRDEGVPAAAVRRVDEALASDGARPLLLGQGKRAGLRTAAWDLGPRLCTELTEPPGLSQHAEAIRREELGLTDEEVSSLGRTDAVLLPAPRPPDGELRRSRRERAP
jgi:crotonobetainyl-CoA:carnitine CoA-transferase CaiB-like acyl-CoA transferase